MDGVRVKKEPFPVYLIRVILQKENDAPFENHTLENIGRVPRTTSAITLT
jgi:hypothetical protein